MPYTTTPQSKKTIEALWRLEKIILDTLDFKEVVQKICDSVLSELGYLKLGYRIIVLTLIDEEKRTLKRISLSQTNEAWRAQVVSTVPFHDIEIPLTASDNLLIKVINEGIPQVTHSWPDIFRPALPDEDALTNQHAAGIKTSLVYPVMVRDKAVGALIFSMVKDDSEVSEDERDLIKGFSDVVGLAVQNAKLYSSLEDTKEQLEVANQKLKELDKLKDEFVSIASHELRTPMTAIKSYLWMALNKKEQMSEDMKRYLTRGYISVERLINLVNDMLNISRIEGGRVALNLEEADIVILAREVVDELLPKAGERGLKLVVQNAQVGKVLCDRDKIHEVLLNLVGNSLKFTPTGGLVIVTFKEQNPYVLVTVADTGRGISQEDLPKLFTKFGRLANSYVAIAESSGTGLGLYITRQIVNLHKGNITAFSEGLDKGSQFTFSLPIAATGIALNLQMEAPKPSEATKELEKTKVI